MHVEDEFSYLSLFKMIKIVAVDANLDKAAAAKESNLQYWRYQTYLKLMKSRRKETILVYWFKCRLLHFCFVQIRKVKTSLKALFNCSNHNLNLFNNFFSFYSYNCFGRHKNGKAWYEQYFPPIMFLVFNVRKGKKMKICCKFRLWDCFEWNRL